MTHPPSPTLIKTWQRYLADERLEERLYRTLAGRASGEEKDILESLAEAERRHQQHWIDLLGEHAGKKRRPSFRTWLLVFFAGHFGALFILALAQQSELRSPYDDDEHATEAMAADEKIHAEVVRALASKSRAKLSGNFRAAVFGANDGLVSNLALVLGVGAAGMSSGQILLTGVSGLLAGALSMGAGEYVSVKSQRELLDASTPEAGTGEILSDLDIDANELALVFRARGKSAEEAEAAALAAITASHEAGHTFALPGKPKDLEEHGTGIGAAASSFCFFASGAIIPILPYIFGLDGYLAVVVAVVLVGLALMATGAIVGILSGAAPGPRALRQLAIGFGAAAVTYVLGLVFGTTVG